MKNLSKLTLALVVGLAASVGQAAELVISKFQKGDRTFLSFDLVDAQGVHGVQFKLNVPGLADADVSKCAAGVAETFNGACNVREESITFTGFTGDARNALNATSVMLGQVSFRSTDRSGTFTVSSALTADAAGNDSELTVTIK